MLLRHTDNLSRTLQKEHISAAEGQSVAAMTTTTLASIRNDECFNCFWQKVTVMGLERDVDEPRLPRQRKRPRRYEEGNAPAEFDLSAKDMYRRVYFESLDLITQAITDRFDQPGYRVYRCLEDLLLKGARGEICRDEIRFVKSIYGGDIDMANLEAQLGMLGSNCKEKEIASIHDIRECLQQFSGAERTLLNEVVTVMKLLLVLPATNASSERSFSALRRIKSYLRSTMGQERLNHLMTLHVHNDSIDSVDLVEVANQFVSGNEYRQRMFGKF